MPGCGFALIALDAVHRGVLYLPAIGCVSAVNDVGKLTLHDAMWVVITSRNAAALLRFGQIDLVLAKPGRGQKIVKDAQHLVRVFFKAGKRGFAEALVNRGFNGGRDVLQLRIELISGLVLRSAAAHHHADDTGEPNLVRRIKKVSCADQGEASHQRQLVVLEQIKPHTVGQRDRRDIRDLDRPQRRILQFLV